MQEAPAQWLCSAEFRLAESCFSGASTKALWWQDGMLIISPSEATGACWACSVVPSAVKPLQQGIAHAGSREPLHRRASSMARWIRRRTVTLKMHLHAYVVQQSGN
jgi:hypothetical protein